MFYLLDVQKMVFYMLTEEKVRYAQISGPHAPIAGTVNGQPKTVVLIRDVQFEGETQRLERQESEAVRKVYNCRFPVARVLPAPVWGIRLDEAKPTGNALGFGKKMYWLCDLQLEQ